MLALLFISRPMLILETMLVALFPFFLFFFFLFLFVPFIILITKKIMIFCLKSNIISVKLYRLTVKIE